MKRGGLTSLRGTIVGFEAAGVAGALVVICIILSLATDSFLSLNNLLGIARRASEYGIVAIAMVFILAMGEVDLSVGAIVSLVNVVTAIALEWGVPIFPAVLMGVVCGIACGALNGLLSVLMQVPVIIVTLGTMSLFHGLAVGISVGPVGKFLKTSRFFVVGSSGVLHIPVGIWLLFIFCVAGYILLHHTPFGWRVQAIGSNRQAARFSGIPLRPYKIIVLGISGGTCAVVAIVSLAYFGSGNAQTGGPGFELFVIASAIIGGTSLSGGAGSIEGAVLGSLLIAVIDNGLTQFSVPPGWSEAVTGGVIIIAVAVSAIITRTKQLEREAL